MMDPRAIARKYVASGWLFLDILAGFPVLVVIKLASPASEEDPTGSDAEAHEGGAQSLARLNQATKIFRIVRVMRVLRIFRLMKLNRSAPRLPPPVPSPRACSRRP